MGQFDDLAAQRQAIHTACQNAQVGTVYMGPVDDPVPPSVMIEDPEMANTQGTMYAVTWTVRMFKVRVDPRATSVAFDQDIRLLMLELLKIDGLIPQTVTNEQPLVSGYALPSMTVASTMPYSLC